MAGLSLDPSAAGPWAAALLIGAALWVVARSAGALPQRALRALLLLTIALAALGVLGGRDPGPRLRVVVLDRSRSLAGASAQSDRAAAQALAGWEETGAEDRVALVLCGAEAQLALPPMSPADARARAAELLALPVADWGTDLAGGLRLAIGLLPPAGGEVFLISDGQDPAAEGGVEALLASGVPVHAFAPQGEALPGARLAAFEGPSRAAPGAELSLRITASSARGASASLVLEAREGRGWRELRREGLRLRAGEARSVGLRTRAPVAGGVLELRARLVVSGPDAAPEDDQLSLRVELGRARAVVVCGRPLPRLASRSLALETIRPSELRAALAAPPALLVLSDVSAASVQDAVPALRAALEGGMGLAVCGLSAFGPGGYAESRLEALLPVRSGPAQERSERLALVVCLDASGSMARPLAHTRYRRAVQEGVPWEALRPEDALGVILFAGVTRTAQALGPRTPDLKERLARVEPGKELGLGTDLGGALLAGLDALSASEAEERLLILASDAEDDPQGRASELQAAAQRLAGPRAPRVLLVGIEARSLAAYQTLADALRPLSVEVARAADAGDSLRELLQSELGARRHKVRTGPFALQATPEGQAQGIELPAAVQAYVPVQVRSGPEAEAYAPRALGRVVDPEGGEGPALVLGRLGRGRVCALPLDSASAQPLISALSAVLLAPRGEARIELEGASLRLVSEGALPLGPLELEARAGALTWRIPLEREAPGLATGVLARREAPGEPLLLLASGGGARLASRALRARAHEELASLGPDFAFLRRLTQASGGRLLTGPSDALPEPPAARPRAWAPWAAGLAALLVVLDAAWAAWGAAQRRAAAALALRSPPPD